ncbi:hypothetical protein EK21DRAFT_119042 [Setomelanomma holmii]|uniref:Uncharacterized protein n=1 Tax=Setomelanomma holmii TaxID=210430 RepID=A0A9P4LFF6_9PLEO|nr:hypothetical protein EK21DRAFT_119042 [Setomelanomma holmii]
MRQRRLSPRPPESRSCLILCSSYYSALHVVDFLLSALMQLYHDPSSLMTIIRRVGSLTDAVKERLLEAEFDYDTPDPDRDGSDDGWDIDEEVDADDDEHEDADEHESNAKSANIVQRDEDDWSFDKW